MTLVEVSLPATFPRVGSRQWVTRALSDDTFCVMVGEEPGGVMHLWIARLDGEPVLSWRDKQRLKSEIAGADAVAVEVFPADDDVIDTANIYHLWVLPPTFNLPFRLEVPWHATKASD